MDEMVLKKRYKYAGDIYPKLIEIGFDDETAQRFLNSIEDSDVVEVVRCKDCIYSKKSGSQWTCLKAIKVGKVWRTNPSNYCASGKRKEE